MESNRTVDLIMETIPTDISGKWVLVEDVRKAVCDMIQPDWDHYSDLPSPSAYQQIKDHVE